MSEDRRAMHVGICRLVFRLPENDNLKGKRRAIQSLSTRIRAKFNVAVAEVGDLDVWQAATLGISCVSNDGRHANAMISNVVTYVTQIRDDLELVDYEVEILDGL